MFPLPPLLFHTTTVHSLKWRDSETKWTACMRSGSTPSSAGWLPRYKEANTPRVDCTVLSLEVSLHPHPCYPNRALRDVTTLIRQASSGSCTAATCECSTQRENVNATMVNAAQAAGRARRTVRGWAIAGRFWWRSPRFERRLDPISCCLSHARSLDC